MNEGGKKFETETKQKSSFEKHFSLKLINARHKSCGLFSTNKIFYNFNLGFLVKGSYINDGLRGEEGQRFCDDSTKALVAKCVTIGGKGRAGEVKKIVKNCVTSFMDDPYRIVHK